MIKDLTKERENPSGFEQRGHTQQQQQQGLGQRSSSSSIPNSLCEYVVVLE
jgi:hypothetical protein